MVTERALSGELSKRGKRLVDLARALNVNKATATRWNKTRVPAERVADVEREMGIPRHMIRPDLWPAPDGAAPTTEPTS